MNYPIFTQNSRSTYALVFRVCLLLLLFFFVAFFIFEIISFFSLFEVKMVTSPGINVKWEQICSSRDQRNVHGRIW